MFSDKKAMILAIASVLFILIAMLTITRLAVEKGKLEKKILTLEERSEPYQISKYDDISVGETGRKARKHKKQTRFEWPELKSVAISLTYDDGLKEHYEILSPLLQSKGLRASFYPIVSSTVIGHADEWKKVAKAGHEIGNHSLFHPCERSKINPVYHLTNYNMSRWRDEMKVANYVLSTIDNREERTVAYPCSQAFVGPREMNISIMPIADTLFTAARTYADNRFILPQNLDYHALPSYAADLSLHSFVEIKAVINEAEALSGWVIFTFHAIGDENNPYSFSALEHDRLLDYLSANQGNYWIAPVIEVSTYLRAAGY